MKPAAGAFNLSNAMFFANRSRTSVKLAAWAAFLLLPLGILGQLRLLPGAKDTAPAAATDPLKRTTPRSAILSFLEACHNNNFVLASQYLDLRRLRPDERITQGAELARDLAGILDRDSKFEVSYLNNTPEGDLADGFPDTDKLDTFEQADQTITLELQREDLQGLQVWLVSAGSVAHIPHLSALAGESAFEKKLPQGLVRTKFVGTPLWIWFALVLLALVLSVVSRLLSRMIIAIAKPVFAHYAKSLQTFRLEAIIEPLRLLVSIVIFRAGMQVLAPSALLRNYLLKLLALLFIFGAASLLMRLVDIVSDRAVSRLDPRQRALSYSVFPLFVRIVKIFLFCIAVLFVLSLWGYSTSTILAGVGVGGIAIALAAQKTIENLFGSISIITDRPVLVGDFCQFGGQTGTVEDIGLRSTRIRTQDRTVVTVPNSVFSTMTLENFSRRDRFWFHPTLHLRRETTPDQIREMMEAIKHILENHPQVNASGIPVRFTKIANESFVLEIYAYVLTSDNDEFLKVQTELLLKILEAASRLKIRFAVPFQESLVAERPADAESPSGASYQSDRTISK